MLCGSWHLWPIKKGFHMKGAHGCPHVACEVVHAVHANRMCCVWALTSWKFVAVPVAEQGVQEQKALSPPVAKYGNNSLLFGVSHLSSFVWCHPFISGIHQFRAKSQTWCDLQWKKLFSASWTLLAFPFSSHFESFVVSADVSHPPAPWAPVPPGDSYPPAAPLRRVAWKHPRLHCPLEWLAPDRHLGTLKLAMHILWPPKKIFTSDM